MDWNGWDVATIRLIEEQRDLIGWMKAQGDGDDLLRARRGADVTRRERLIRALEVAFEAYVELYPSPPSTIRGREEVAS